MVDLSYLRSDVHTPDLTQQWIQGSCKPLESLLLQGLQLCEEEQQDRGPGLAVGLAGEGEEVGDDLGAERQQLGLDLIPAVGPSLVQIEPEHREN